MKINHEHLADLVVELQATYSNDVFDELYSITYGNLYQLSLKILEHEQDAQDAVNEAYYLIYRNIHSLENPRGFLAWSRRIVCNISLTGIRKRRDIPTDNIQGLAERTLPPEPDSLDMMIATEKNSDLLDMICNLDPAILEMVVMKYYHGLTFDEIGVKLNMPVGTIKAKLHRTKKSLQKKAKANRTLLALPIGMTSITDILSTLDATTTGSSLSSSASASTTSTSSKYNSFAKGVAIVTGSTVIVSGTLMAGQFGSSFIGNSTPSVELSEPTINITSYEDNQLRLNLYDANNGIDFGNVYLLQNNGSKLGPIAIFLGGGELTFDIHASTVTLYVGMTDGRELCYELILD